MGLLRALGLGLEGRNSSRLPPKADLTLRDVESSPALNAELAIAITNLPEVRQNVGSSGTEIENTRDVRVTLVATRNRNDSFCLTNEGLQHHYRIRTQTLRDTEKTGEKPVTLKNFKTIAPSLGKVFEAAPIEARPTILEHLEQLGYSRIASDLGRIRGRRGFSRCCHSDYTP